MDTHSHVEWALVAAALTFGMACSSGGGGGGGDAGGNGGGSGTGPCATGTQAECQKCVDDAAAICNAGMCRQEDLDLQNCAVSATWNPCIDPTTGATTLDCCQVPQKILINCWNRCPEMQACS